MRRVVGKRVVDLTAAEFTQLRGRHAGMLLDVGTGDGKHVLQVARQRPDLLVVGLDASPDGMRRSAASAARAAAKGGVPNALFVWAAVEQLPAELTGARELHVLMPWGSLLRGMLGPDPGILTRLAAACSPGAAFLVTLNLHAWRPPVPEVGDTAEPTPESATDELAKVYRSAGWQLEQASYLTGPEVDALGTSWTKRLGSSRQTLDVLSLRGTVLAS